MKVAIIGTAPSSRHLAPYGDDTWEIWACSPGNRQQLPRITVWFELHGPNILNAPENRGWAEPYIDWLEAQRFAVFAPQAGEVVKRSMTFPRTELVEKYGDHFFTSTPAWMMAMAMEKEATEIALFGIDMAAEDEWGDQRQGLQHFVWLARQKGIIVRTPLESDILSPGFQYGYAEETHFGVKMMAREKELQGRLAEAQQRQAQANYDVAHLQGALANLRYTRKMWPV